MPEVNNYLLQSADPINRLYRRRDMMPTYGGPKMTPDEERQVEQVMIDSVLHPAKDNLAHNPEDCQTSCDVCRVAPCRNPIYCRECGACQCEEGDHRLDCLDYVH